MQQRYFKAFTCLLLCAAVVLLLQKHSYLPTASIRQAVIEFVSFKHQSPGGNSSSSSSNSSNSSSKYVALSDLHSNKSADLNQQNVSITPITLPNITGAPLCKRPHSQDAFHLPAGTTVAPPRMQGGFWWPSDCWPPLSHTAVLVPYRNRSENLKSLLPHLQRTLQLQHIMFGIFVIEQGDNKAFNRARLINVGFKTAMRYYRFDCIVLHDADKLPENVANMYDCRNSPILLMSQMRAENSTKYKRGMLYSNYFGGVNAITPAQFKKINGLPNNYFGWGREDDEFSARLRLSGMRLHYMAGPVGRFVNLQHGNDLVINKMPWPHPNKVKQRMKKDGLNSLQYQLVGLQKQHLFVLLKVLL